MKKHFSFLLPMIVFGTGLFLASSTYMERSEGTGTLKGMVTDSAKGTPIAFATVWLKGTSFGTFTDDGGMFEIKGIPVGSYEVVANLIGYRSRSVLDVTIENGQISEFSIILARATEVLSQIQVIAPMNKAFDMVAPDMAPMPSYYIGHDAVRVDTRKRNRQVAKPLPSDASLYDGYFSEGRYNTEEYDNITENEFKTVISNPLSTFSIDVDNASYSNVRRFLTMGQMPVADAVRIEEMVNYFSYDYDDPKGDVPFSVFTEMLDCPWNRDARLVHIGIQGKKLDYEELDPSNLVFLMDVSGSMNHPAKLPLVKSALYNLVDQLSSHDKVAIVVYAGAAGLVLPSTSGGDKGRIKEAIDNLSAGGSTAGGAGIKLAYKVVQDNFMKEGNNRVILLTDGDFNVGASSDAELVRLIEEKRESGVFLTVCGFGMGNYKDSKMEKLADRGNGNYFYIDNEKEADKVFVREMRATLFTIAKDVKIQVEFNPAKVESYRLVGYENRLLNKEDFDDDTKDAGELGAGHTVTAMYEIIPTKSFDADAQIDHNRPTDSNDGTEDLRYQQTRVKPDAYEIDEVMVVKLRYKDPRGTQSRLIEKPLANEYKMLIASSNNFRWAAAVAEFGMLLRDSKFKGDADYAHVLELARGSKGTDLEGDRAEFIDMVRSCMKVVASR